jgi:hypothetical protein
MTNIGIKIGVIALALVMALAGAFSFGAIGAAVGLLLTAIGVYGAIKMLGTSEISDGKFDATR